MSNVHTVAETVNMKATHFAARIFDCVCDADIDNGTFGYMDGLADGFDHIYNFKVGTSEGKAVVMAHNPEWTCDTSRRTNQRKDKFFIPAKTPFRAYVVCVDDEIGLSTEGFASVENAEVGKFVSIDTNGKLAVADAAPEGAVMVGEIMRTRMLGGLIETNVRNYGYTRKMYEIKVNSMA